MGKQSEIKPKVPDEQDTIGDIDDNDSDGNKYSTKKDGVKKQPISITSVNWTLFIIVTILGLFTRLYRLDSPHYVVFDEVHFGKFASYYLRREFFFDVHPPLGKLLVAFSGWLAGYNGNYLFDEIGQDYLTISKEGPIPYYIMRFFPAMMGALQVPLSYLTVLELGGGNLAACVTAFLFIFENAHVTQTRLILLDASLMLFIVWAFYAFSKFSNYSHQAFSREWLFWLCQTGVGLGCAVSVKFVGLFIIATVGLHTVYELWNIFSDRRNPMPHVIRHFLYRVLFLIIVPVSIFTTCFYIHFAILTHSGTGDAHMSSQFQVDLIGNSLNAVGGSMPEYVAYGSKITIRNTNSKPSCWLHSHPSRYPLHHNEGTAEQRVSSAQQQVTCYAHQDQNNEFIIFPADTTNEAINFLETKPVPDEVGGIPAVLDAPALTIPKEVRYVQSGDEVKLLHLSTMMLLNGHDVASATQPSKQEVSCWNASEALTGQTTWKIDFTVDRNGKWKPFVTHFSLEHVGTSTTLELSGENLPEWGFSQAEVVSSKMSLGTHETWFVDTVVDDRLESKVVERMHGMGFFGKLVESIHVMLDTNSKLSSKHVYASRPLDWVRLVRGISFYQAKEDKGQIYLLGNPVSWWACHMAAVIFLVLAIVFTMREARGFYDVSEVNRRRFQRGMGLVLLAWALHYIPFFPMDRQLFLHHYLPASYFMLVLAGLFTEIMLTRMPEVIK
eukprot:Ihof_evm1s464 gene=Ihof_evmTU1s464